MLHGMLKTSANLPDFTYLKGVGPFVASCFQKLGITTIPDLLGTPPSGYEDYRNLPTISKLPFDQTVLFKGQVLSVSERKPKPRLSIITLQVQDQTGVISVLIFNQGFLKKSLQTGKWVLIKGKVGLFQSQKQVSAQRVERLNEKESLVDYPHQLVPIYHLTKGLKQSRYRQVIRAAWDVTHRLLWDPLPTDIQQKCGLMTFKDALQALHFPISMAQAEKGRSRLAFDDFFYHQLALAYRKIQSERHTRAPQLSPNGHLVTAYRKQLPYTLTSAQESVIDDIAHDIQFDRPMNRLVQGDVGAGKTEVAVLSILATIQSGKTATFIAPTQVLAEQHFFKLSDTLAPLGVDVVLLKGKMRKKEREATLERLADPTPCVIVGTHAIIQTHIEVLSLGLVIMDEQHRFGVLQRMHFANGTIHPHALFLSATPIPRSMVLTVYGDLEKSIIGELPPGRKPSKTVFLKPSNLDKIYAFCQSELSKGRQVYLVFPLVDTSEKIDLQAAIDAYNNLSESTFKGTPMGLMHGQLSPKDKTAVMAKFKSGETQILVATTVIEVGVDVPNATVMVIHHAERFGLSQLHQLRGRVGRGADAATCFLVGDPKTDSGKSRLQAMVETQDGFKIAEKDLEIRGPGDFVGTRQSGLPNFQVADLLVDHNLLQLARKAAFHVAKSDPDLAHPDLRPMKEKLINQYGHLLDGRLN